MGRPYVGYKIDGERVPGVTTILSRFKESGGLIHWAWEQGRDGKDYRETRDAAANAGTCAHDMVECDIRGKTFDPTGYDEKMIERATGAFNAYLEWKHQTNLQVKEAEVSLLCKLRFGDEEIGFGGTLDAMFVQGKLSLGDFKTSNSTYSDYIIQLAGYKLLWEYNFPEQPIDGGYHILRFSKQEHPDDPVSFCHHYWSDIDIAVRQFKLMLQAYANDKRLKKMV
jgi:hypothetical protein